MIFPDPRFFRRNGVLSIAEAAEIGGAEIVRGSGSVETVAELSTGGDGALVFAEKLKGAPAPAVALIVPEGQASVCEDFPGAVLEARSPKLAFSKIAAAMFTSFAEEGLEGEGPGERGEACRIHQSAVIDPSAVLGANVVIGPGSFVGPGVVIGDGTSLAAQVSITHATLGKNCRIHAGAKIGEAGFGYTAGETGPQRVPQLGAVRIGDEVDIGALTTVDRGMLSDTVIGDLTKIDNLCQVAHNCRIGRGVLIASQTGISGSCTIGDYVMMGGQVGMADHLHIGDGAVIAAKAGLMRDVEPGGKVGGTPAKPMRQWMKETAALGRLANGK
ncbi:UDP-3-O-(3-hydroxymyristoyl)glucosamine N-acyltransferase [Parvularcula maris]|uniref:UDP-3-O-(3-hydroxymyristoyl)glucosamine N-acyltransferase n=1 Tax=Parvularcula maris TaxID=2965077 RepID=A0A9X2RI12_9PROT|nr:UDP-3-O-(3-hydroxymyristoyl)glucosamine N-acyltransferase [Parvularcula maris]MCQ8185550.1 UDP-3-O-(3-hydroxymyristoyl)glucosamine N-acyltransferase [Parvularcula maris]